MYITDGDMQINSDNTACSTKKLFNAVEIKSNIPFSVFAATIHWKQEYYAI